MNNEPIAYIPDTGLKTLQDGSWCVANAVKMGDSDIPLYTHQYERPHNTVLVPCDKLAEMQAEINALKLQLHTTLTNRNLRTYDGKHT